jgi:enoyl-CoA hydratase/carnithine racemase
MQGSVGASRREAYPMHLSTESIDRMAVVRLDRAVTNAINGEMVEDLSNTLKSLASDENVKGVVLTSANDKFFSIGLDIPLLFDLDVDQFRSFYHSFNQVCVEMLCFPKPLVAALSGHAIAGGYILAVCCDYRLIAEGRKLVGLNEIKLGVPVPYVADSMLRTLIGFAKARQVMDQGVFFEPYDARNLGLVDEIYPAEDLLERTLRCVSQLSENDLHAFAAIKLNRLEPVLADVENHIEAQETLFVDLVFRRNTP